MISLAQACLLSAFVSLIIGVLIYGQNPTHAVNRMLVVLSGILFYYEFTGGFEFLQAGDAIAAFQSLRLDAFWYLLPLAVFHACVIYANLRVRRLVLCSMYGSAILFSLLEALVAPYEVFRVPWGWAYRYTGYWGCVQVLWVTVPTIAAMLVLMRRYHTVKSREEKAGVAYVFSGTLIPVVTGILGTVLPFLTSVDVPDLTTPAAAIGFLLVGYAVLRYGVQILTTSAATNDILSTMVDALFLVDTEGKIIVSNKAASKLLECETSDLNGRQLNTVTQESKIMEALLGSNFPASLETDFKTKQNRQIPVSVSRSLVVTKRGSLMGYVLICRDITERKRMEARLAETERLAAIGETTSMVGHDLRNPLQAMTAALYSAKKLAASEKAEDKKELIGMLSTLDDTIQYMDKVVSDLQDYSRMVTAELFETNLLELVKGTVSNVKIPENVEVNLKIQGDSSNVKLDPNLFRRVLTNLILNAVQAMPEGGKLTIASSTGGGSIAVAVRDTGVGIPPENLERVFTPFFTTKAKGQGLGLAVCKRLMEAQGGTINVTSQLGKGSTFTLEIPTGDDTS